MSVYAFHVICSSRAGRGDLAVGRSVCISEPLGDSILGLLEFIHVYRLRRFALSTKER
jgi:hypothetical protein